MRLTGWWRRLGKSDDPRAIFALIELSSDKEVAVKETALRSLERFKKEEGEAIVSLEKLFAERREIKKPEETPQVQQKMMPTIEKLFSHYDPKKREAARRKLLPSLEKLFGIHALPQSDPLHGVEAIAHGQEAQKPPEEKEERVPQQNAPNFPFGQREEALPKKSDSLPIEAIENSEDELGEEAAGEEEEPHAASKYYELAYKIATTPGMGKAELKREQNRIISNFKREVGLAFKMAEERAKEDGLASFSNLKPGMKGLSFAEMEVVGITGMEYGARKKPFEKIRLSDGKREISLLVPQERARGINSGERLALKGVAVDFLVESSEVVLVAKPKSKIILVK